MMLLEGPRMLISVSWNAEFVAVSGNFWRKKFSVLYYRSREESWVCDWAVQTYVSSARTRIGLIKLGAGTRVG